MIKKEQPEIRDILAAQVASTLISKTVLTIDSDKHLTRHLTFHEKNILGSVAFMAYQLADALLDERIKKS